MKHLDSGKLLVDLGCGNGRDSLFFARNGVNTIGGDISENEMNYLNTRYGSDVLKFMAGDMGNMSVLPINKVDHIYSRFSLHAISIDNQNKLIEWIGQSLNQEGYLFIEARSNKDKMLLQGKRLSNNENFTDHYRRYLDFEKTLAEVRGLGLIILESLEKDNLSVYNEDNPVLIRIIAQMKK